MARPFTVKGTSKNQVTIPDALMRELGRPSHFKAYNIDGKIALFPAKLATFDEQAKNAGIPPAVLKRAYALHAEKRAAQAAAAAAEAPPAIPAQAGGS